MNNKRGFAITAIAVVAALLVTTSAMSANNAFAGGHQYSKTTQALAQTNACGNGFLPHEVDCQNAASQIQGKHNTASVAAAQPESSNDHGGDHGRDHGRDHGSNGGDSQAPE